MAYIHVDNVSKIYHTTNQEITALSNVSFQIEQGEFVVIVGPSGAGKTTLLNLLGGMDQVSEGTLTIDHEDITHYNEKQLTAYRQAEIGFVFQFYNLIGNLTAYENVELATEIKKKDVFDSHEILEKVGLLNRMNNFPSQLSGGEQQRVAIARAIAKKPKLLLCDEPTGALDTKTGQQILELLQTISTEYNMTVIIITHNSNIAQLAQKVITVADGTIKSIKQNEKPKTVQEIEW